MDLLQETELGKKGASQCPQRRLTADEATLVPTYFLIQVCTLGSPNAMSYHSWGHAVLILVPLR